MKSLASTLTDTVVLARLARLSPLATLAVALTAAVAFADAGTSIETGRGYFLSYCASCHGADAQGDGPVAPALKTKPSDLTRIAARRDGVFGREQLTAYITGSSSPPAHGNRDMPVWGANLVEHTGEGDSKHMVARDPLRGVLHYLESIQR